MSFEKIIEQTVQFLVETCDQFNVLSIAKRNVGYGGEVRTKKKLVLKKYLSLFNYDKQVSNFKYIFKNLLIYNKKFFLNMFSKYC